MSIMLADRDRLRYERQKKGAEQANQLRRRFGMKRITNVTARQYVQKREKFHGNNLYGEWRGDRYVVTSYGDHFPLFIWENGTWYENIDKYSVTTSKHRTQTHPHEDTLPMTCNDMVVIMNHGIVGVAVGLAV